MTKRFPTDPGRSNACIRTPGSVGVSWGHPACGTHRCRRSPHEGGARARRRARGRVKARAAKSPAREGARTRLQAPWRLKYRAAGKEKTLALGAYPERILVQARDDTQDARRIIRDGVDPSAQRKQERRAQRIRAENSFEVPAREWHAKSEGQMDDRPRSDDSARVETHLFAALGPRSIAEIDAPERLDALRLIERKAETRSRGWTGAVDPAFKTLARSFLRLAKVPQDLPSWCQHDALSSRES